MSKKQLRFREIQHPIKLNKSAISFVKPNGDRGMVIGGGHHYILDKHSKELHFPTIFGYVEALREVARLNREVNRLP